MGRGITVAAAVLAVTSCQPSQVTTGTVTGGIIPCSGILVPSGPHYAAGTVTVLKGQIVGGGTGRLVMPTTAVARQSVATDAMYRFVLEPGPYVLQAQFPPPSNVLPFASVTVHAGDELHVDIPNMCV